MTHEEARDLIPGYAVDALEPEEAARVEAHLLSCGDCRGELAVLRDAAASLATGVAQTAPPPEMRNRIIRATGGQGRRMSSSQRGWIIGMAVAAGLIILLGGIDVVLQQRLATVNPEAFRRLVDAGTPDELVQAQVPVQRRFAARTYLDKYGPDARYDYLAHLPRVKKPLLLTVGSLEADNVSFTGLVQDGAEYAARWPNVAADVIDGADHGYTDRTDALWAALEAWLTRTAATMQAYV